MLGRVGILLLALAFCGREASAATGCEPAPYVAGVPYFTEQMSAVAAPPGTVSFRSKSDPRISADLSTRAAAHLSSQTRLGFVSEINGRFTADEAATRSRGGQFLVAAIPFAPAGYRVVRRSDPDLGIDRIVGRLVVFVSSSCELVIDYQAPDAMVLRAQFGDLSAAVDSVRDAVGRLAPSLALHDESSAPQGGLAYLVGLGLPAGVAMILALLLGRSVAKGSPGTLSKAAMLFVAMTAALVVAGSKYAGFPPEPPPEILALIGAVAVGAVVASFLPFRVPLRFAISFGCAGGFAIVGYALLGWVSAPHLVALTGACISLGSVLAALWWTRATGRFMMPIL